MLLSHFKVGKVKLGVISFLIGLICVFSSTPAFTQTAAPQTTLPQQIRIGTRTAAFAIGRSDSNGQISGFCGDAFQDGLRQELLRRGIQSTVSNRKIANQYRGIAFPRYNELIKEEIEIECGTNSPLSGELIDEATGKYFKDEIAFSEPFYQSGIKLLLKVEQAEILNKLAASEQEIEVYKLAIGAIKNTTTLKQLQEKGKTPISYTTREEALDDLDAGRRIEAYASDALIIQTLLEEGIQGDDSQKARPSYKENGFILFPLKARDYLPGLDKESFAIAIKKNTPYASELLDIINDTLNSIQNRNGLANVERDYKIPDSNRSALPSQVTAEAPTAPNSEFDPSTPGLIILALFAALGTLGMFTMAIIALARGNILHQHGSGDNVAGDKVRRNKINTQNNDSHDEDT